MEAFSLVIWVTTTIPEEVKSAQHAHVPLHSLQLALPQGLAGSGIGKGRYEINGPSLYQCGSCFCPLLHTGWQHEASKQQT